MAVTQLILLSDITAVKPLSVNTNETKKVNPNILEAQEFDLKPVLGDEMYLKLLEEKANSFPDTLYADLWNGKEYTYNNDKYVFQGIKQALIYWSYARIITNLGQDDTAFGVMQKLNDYSQQVDSKTLAMRIKQAQSGAVAFQNDFIAYLDRKREDYPLWQKWASCPDIKRNATFKSRKIGG